MSGSRDERRIGSRYARNRAAPWVTKHAIDRASMRLLELWLADHPDRGTGISYWITGRAARAADAIRDRVTKPGNYHVRHDGVQFLFEVPADGADRWNVVTVCRADAEDVMPGNGWGVTKL